MRLSRKSKTGLLVGLGASMLIGGSVGMLNKDKIVSSDNPYVVRVSELTQQISETKKEIRANFQVPMTYEEFLGTGPEIRAQYDKLSIKLDQLKKEKSTLEGGDDVRDIQRKRDLVFYSSLGVYLSGLLPLGIVLLGRTRREGEQYE